jgi:hypothetical protein
MAAHITFQSIRRPLHSWLASIDQLDNLGASIVEGLGEFGLAANGMCPTLLARTTPLQRESKPSVVSEPAQ